MAGIVKADLHTLGGIEHFPVLDRPQQAQGRLRLGHGV